MTDKTSNTQKNDSPVSQTGAGKVRLVMHAKQWPSTTVEVGGVTLTRDEPVEVSAKDADALLERRDERGHRYAQRA